MSNLRGETSKGLAADPPRARRRLCWLGALGGGALCALAAVFVLGGVDLGVGSARRLGAGAFPFLSGLVLAVISLGVALADLRDWRPAERPDWVFFAAVGGALAVFALVVERFGLIPAVFLAAVTASLPDRSMPWAMKAVLGLVVALASWGLFIGLLDLPLQALKGV